MNKLCFIVFLLCLGACSFEEKKTKQWTKEHAKKFIDESEMAGLVAGCNEGEGHLLFIKNTKGFTGIRKITRIPGYPDMIDSLIQRDKNTFTSQRNTSIYVIHDSEVTVTYFQKIIHPSSNWQGQTPWQETIVAQYPRSDLNLK